jgi:hypothetical protein|uniref:DUF1874 domain-containing protein n=1 Tax=Candidatus Aramenus sulfurataquae TaxID=1326980 RepID=A0AAE3FNQ3_9CREN|nr:DUF1874 domain-containing protein [Candidatus Aramenus sulfurataquae]
MKIYLANAFSLNMIQGNQAIVHVQKIMPEVARDLVKYAEVESYVGHEVTAKLMSLLLGIEVPVNRSELKIRDGEIIVLTLSSRLPEGTVIKSIEDIQNIKYQLWHVMVMSVG